MQKEPDYSAIPPVLILNFRMNVIKNKPAISGRLPDKSGQARFGKVPRIAVVQFDFLAFVGIAHSPSFLFCSNRVILRLENLC